MSNHKPFEPLTLIEFPDSSYADWKKEAEAGLKGAPFDKKLISKTYEGIDLHPIYTREDSKNFPHASNLPGAAPYIRSTKASGFTSSPWLIAQEITAGTPKEFNQALRKDLERGQTAVNLPLDKAGRLGLDPDQAKSNEVALCGVSVATLADLKKALDGVDLSKTPIFVQAGSSGLIFSAMLSTLATEKKVDLSKLKGCIESDPIGELVADGTLPVSLDTAFQELAIVTRWAKKYAPGLKTISLRSHPYHDSGANAVQELAYLLATAVDTIRSLQKKGLSIEEIATQTRFSLSLGSHYFMELAKCRAARWLWARVIEQFGGCPECQKLTIHGRTSLFNKTAIDPYVNLLRTTTEAFSGALGGCDSLHVGPFDEVLRAPDDFSRRIARNTQLILQNECHLTRVIDPAGGSWFVETLTVELAEKAWALFQEIEKQGGMLKAIQSGYIQNQISETTKQRLDAVAKRRETVVGVNQYANVKEEPLKNTTASPDAIYKKRSAELAEYRTSPDHAEQTATLGMLAKVLSSPPEAVMEALIDSIRHGATLGEITKTLRASDGARPAVQPVKIQRISQEFEDLRQASAAWKAKTGKAPQIFLAAMGPLSQHKVRADFSRGFVAPGGFEVIYPKGFSSVSEAAAEAAASGAGAVVICSTDETYPEIVPALTAAIKKSNPKIIILLAGYPQEHVEAFKQAGVDEFIHIRANCHQLLLGLQKKMGVHS